MNGAASVHTSLLAIHAVVGWRAPWCVKLRELEELEGVGEDGCEGVGVTAEGGKAAGHIPLSSRTVEGVLASPRRQNEQVHAIDADRTVLLGLGQKVSQLWEGMEPWHEIKCVWRG